MTNLFSLAAVLGLILGSVFSGHAAEFRTILQESRAQIDAIAGKEAAKFLAARRLPRSTEIARCIRDRECREPFVVSHRAQGFGEPENSRAAVKKAVDSGLPIIEVDLRLSQDGVMFIMHDETLDRTTDAEGNIKDYTAEELAQFRLKNGETIPTLAEIYAISRGRALLDLDIKDTAIEYQVVPRLAAWIDKYGSFDDFIFLIYDEPITAVAAEIKRKYPQMIINANFNDLSENKTDRIERLFGGLPDIVHMRYPKASCDVVKDLHSRGAKVFSNNFWKERLLMGKLSVYRMVKCKVDFVQTDNPNWYRHQMIKAEKAQKRRRPARRRP